MNYAIQGTGVTISDEIRSYVEKRLQTLDRFGGEGARCDLELEYRALWDGPKYRVEILCHDPGADTRRVEAEGTTLHEAIDIAAGELSRVLTQSKKKRLQVFRRTAVKVKEYLRGWRDKI